MFLCLYFPLPQIEERKKRTEERKKITEEIPIFEEGKHKGELGLRIE